MGGGIDDSSNVSRQYENADNLNARMRLHRLYTVESEPFYQFIRRNIALKAGENALEGGAGNGSLWVGAELPVGARLTLTDISEGMVRTLAERFAASGQIATLKADACCLPFSDGEFDIVIANHMLYHVPDMRAALREMRRTLKDGGRFFASTVGDGNFRQLWEATGTEAPKIKFTLDNGGALLGEFFSSVKMYEHPSKLMITNARHAVEYMESSISLGAFARESSERLFRVLNDKIASDGAFEVTKRAGLFVCEK